MVVKQTSLYPAGVVPSVSYGSLHVHTGDLEHGRGLLMPGLVMNVLKR